MVLLLVIFLRYAVIALAAFLIFYRLKRKTWAYRKIQLRFPQDRDYWREFGYSVLTSVIFAAIGYVVFFTPFRAFTRVYVHYSDHSTAYFLFSIVLILLVHDTYFYWTHRAMHHPRVYRFVHRVHHLSVNPSPWAAFAFHPLEAVVEAGIIVLVALLFPVHPLAIAIFLLIMMVYNVYGHLGYELYPRGFSRHPLGRWINTSVNHNQHHETFKGNYGLYFLWWDRWMHTLRTDYDDKFEEVQGRVKPG